MIKNRITFVFSVFLLSAITLISVADEEANTKITTVLFDASDYELGENHIINKKYGLLLAPAISVKNDDDASYFASTGTYAPGGFDLGRYLFMFGTTVFIPSDSLLIDGAFRLASIYDQSQSLIFKYGRSLTLIPMPKEFFKKRLEGKDDVSKYVNSIRTSIADVHRDVEMRGKFPSLKIRINHSALFGMHGTRKYFLTFSVSSRGAVLHKAELTEKQWNLKGKNQLKVAITNDKVCFSVNSNDIGCVPHLDTRNHYVALLLTGLKGQYDGLFKVSVEETKRSAK
jgi:hypothetical protein